MTKSLDKEFGQSAFKYSVEDFGAVGDGVTDDTDAIQAGINFVYERGGGTLYFPFTKQGYRIAKPAREQIDGKPCRSQLYIPSEPSDYMQWRNVCLEGEMPARQLHRYQLTMEGNWPRQTEFPLEIGNVCLVSDWEAPEEHDRNARPWSLIAVLGGHKLAFGLGNLTIRNLEFRVFLNTDKMYPVSSAANFKSTSCLIIEHSYFGLDKNIGSVSNDKELLANPCHAAGVIASADQNDHQILTSVGVQGFRYGFVLGEHVTGGCLYVHNCEEGIVFHDSSHFSVIEHVVAQHNRTIVSALREPAFDGLFPSENIHIRINAIDCESGVRARPLVSRMQYGVYDPDNRITGEITYHVPYWDADHFAVVGAKRMRIVKFGDWRTNN